MPARVCKGIIERGLYGVMGYRRPTHREGYFHKREYASDAKRCANCPQRSQCTQSKNHQKLITRHVWQAFKDEIDANRLTDLGKRLYAPRKETVERSFADAKELHGHRYARFRGLAKVQAQCLLSAACQNMKKMALVLARKAKKEAQAALLRLYQAIRSAQIAFKTAGWPRLRFELSFH